MSEIDHAGGRIYARPSKPLGEMADDERRAFAERLYKRLMGQPDGGAVPDDAEDSAAGSAPDQEQP